MPLVSPPSIRAHRSSGPGDTHASPTSDSRPPKQRMLVWRTADFRTGVVANGGLSVRLVSLPSIRAHRSSHAGDRQANATRHSRPPEKGVRVWPTVGLRAGAVASGGLPLALVIRPSIRA